MSSAIQLERKFKAFLRDYDAKKIKNGKITHTRIPKYYGDPKDKDPRNIYGGSWIIPEDKLEEFHKLYIDYVFVHNKKEYLTEAQRDPGQILIDLDFHYTLDIQNREDIYLNCENNDWQEARKDQILTIIEIYLICLAKLLIIDKPFSVYVFEKENTVVVPDKKITKDGIHMVFTINLGRREQEKLRELVLSEISLRIEAKDFMNELPNVINKEKWNDVIDFSIASGNTNWQMLGSQKPENKRYELVYGFTFELDDKFEWTLIEEIEQLTENESKLEYIKNNFVNLGANGEGNVYQLKNNTILANIPDSTSNSSSGGGNLPPGIAGLLAPTFIFPNINEITDQPKLDAVIEAMLSLENLRPTEFERLKNTHEYCMILPAEYSDDYTLWKKVGWALKNADYSHQLNNRLFLTYLKFSSQSNKFDFNNIGDLWNDWLHKSKVGDTCLSERSIFYWARNSNPEEFNKIKQNSIEHFIDLSFRSNGADWDLASVLHQLFKDLFVSPSYTKNIWYTFVNHCWEESESGVELSREISLELYNIYHDKTLEMVQIMSSLENDKDEWKDFQQKVTISSNICNKLKNNTSKKNIMAQCKELFYDKNFFDLVDKNCDLLCCGNGVINLETGEFRKGYPEDYITKCTDNDYIYPSMRDKNLVNEVNEFWSQIFPEEDVGRYVWDIFAGALSGNNVNQLFHIFLGAGSNGKSAIMTLMRMVFGEKKGRGYYAQTPIQYLTQERTKAGAASSDLAQLPGVRLTSIDEPEKGEKLNVGIMKQLTGGDPLTARLLFKDSFTFIPQFTFVALTNNLFEIAATDKGTWRRISVPPYKATFTSNPYNDPEFPKDDFPIQHMKDPDLPKTKFPLWSETVLSMLVERILTTKGRIEKCDIVDQEVKKYKCREDHIQQFIDTKISQAEGNVLKQRDLGIEFKEWYSDKFNGKIKRMQDLYEAFDKKYKKHGSGWVGIDICSEA